MVRLMNSSERNFTVFYSSEFTKDCFKVDDLRADIAKLNVNITSSCLSQGIHVELSEAWYTFENLWKLFTVKQYPTRLV